MLKFDYQEGTPILVDSPCQIIFINGCVSVLPIDATGAQMLAAAPMSTATRFIADADLENAAALLETEMAKYLPAPKKRGKAIDPNSNLQRVNRCVHEILSTRGPIPGFEVRLELKNRLPDLSVKKIRENAGQVKGILRDGKNWSLKA